jgi:flagellar protein FliT
MQHAADADRLLDAYAAIEQSSRDMLDAAQRRDWERFAALHADCSALIDEVRRAGGASLQRDAQRTRLRIMRRIVQNEALIRRLSFPWTDRYEQMLFGSAADGPRSAGPA